METFVIIYSAIECRRSVENNIIIFSIHIEYSKYITQHTHRETGFKMLLINLRNMEESE